VRHSGLHRETGTRTAGTRTAGTQECGHQDGGYPLSLLFQALVPHLNWLPVPLRALALPVVLVTLMTYAIMPFVTRLLRRWLYPLAPPP